MCWILFFLILWNLLWKEPNPIFFFIFSNVLGNLVSQEGYIFLMTHAKFYSWKLYRLKDIIKNEPG